MKFLLLLLSAALCYGTCAAPAKTARTAKKKISRRAAVKTYYNAKFVKGSWNRSDWEMVRSWRFDHDAQFIQLANCIQNKVPEGVSDRELQGKKGHPGYAIMLLKQKFKGNAVITCNMEFDYRMAPGIVIAHEPVKFGKDKLELREHYEVILYDDGLNLWHHYFEKGSTASRDPRVIRSGVVQKWRKQFYCLDPKFYKAKTKYEVKVSIRYTGRGPYLQIACGGRVIGGYVPAMPKGQYRIGLVGCEGRNRFYDFKVTDR